jgi:hypothetical protein
VANPHETNPAFLHDLVASWHSTRRQPRMAAAKRRMAREGKLLAGREDANTIVRK